MSEWETYRVGGLIADGKLTINDGYRAKNVELSTSGVPFARAANINNGFHFDGTDRFPSARLPEIGIKVSKSGDVVFTSKGTVGRFAFVADDIETFVYSPQLCFWRSNDWDFIDPRFLFFWMRGPEFFAQYMRVKGQTDMADYVSLTDQRRMQISLPSIDTQREIAHILGTLDDKIDLNRRMNATLEEMARALFKSWFVDFDPVRAKAEGRDPVGMDAETAALFPDGFEESTLGPIPRGWRVGSLGEVSFNVRQNITTDAMSSDTAYIGLEHMPRGSIALSDWSHAGDLESNKSSFSKGDLLFGKLRPYFKKVGIAPMDGVCSTDILVIRPANVAWRSYVLSWISSDRLIDHTTALSSGTRMPRAKWQDISNFTVALPTREVASTFERQVTPMIDTIVANIYEDKALAEMRDALLPRLMRGELVGVG
jgi:type I restriction enzyme S subunit